jgi:hypothetical protein
LGVDCNRAAAVLLTYDRPVSAGSSVAKVQSATGVLMVRPARFGHNAQTAATNRFQTPGRQSQPAAALAREEFDALARSMGIAGVRVCVIDDTPDLAKPDAVFPNNWVSFHSDGTVVLYPMLAPNRRAERRLDVLTAVETRLNFRRRRLLDLTGYEQEGRFLEGTGSLVLDHVQRIAYACRSARTDPSLVRIWSQQMDYEPVLFDAKGSDGTPIYHTNVLLSIGSDWAVVCADAILAADRSRVLQGLGKAREVIEIGLPVMAQFGANILELRAPLLSAGPQRLLLLSETARAAFERQEPQGWGRLRHAVERLVAVPVPTIEAIGGGGVRCMLAEVPEFKRE